MPAGLPGQKVKLGKWHLSSYDDFAVGVALGGYDFFVGVRSNVETYYNYEQWFASPLGSNSAVLTTHHTTQLASDVLAELAFGTELIHASFCAIHTPLALPPNDEPPGHVYAGGTQQDIKHDMLFHLDYWLGQIFAQALAKGYIIIVTCDNGTDGDGKGLYFEAGPNTNLIVLGKGVAGQFLPTGSSYGPVGDRERSRGDTSGLQATDSLDFTDDFLAVPQVDAPREIMRLDWSGFLGVPTPLENWSRMLRDDRWKYVNQTFAPKPTPPGVPLIAFHDPPGGSGRDSESAGLTPESGSPGRLRHAPGPPSGVDRGRAATGRVASGSQRAEQIEAPTFGLGREATGTRDGPWTSKP